MFILKLDTARKKNHHVCRQVYFLKILHFYFFFSLLLLNSLNVLFSGFRWEMRLVLHSRVAVWTSFSFDCSRITARVSLCGRFNTMSAQWKCNTTGIMHLWKKKGVYGKQATVPVSVNPFNDVVTIWFYRERGMSSVRIQRVDKALRLAQASVWKKICYCTSRRGIHLYTPHCRWWRNKYAIEKLWFHLLCNGIVFWLFGFSGWAYLSLVTMTAD